MAEKKSSSILFVTRPLSPPWDEASKNLAYFLARNISDFQIDVMTKEILPGFSDNIHQNPVYSASEISGFTFSEKLKALNFQWKSKGRFDVVHYFFTPTRLNSFLIRNFLKSPRTKTIQTVATLREDLWSEEDLKKLIFADEIITYSDYSRKKLEKLGFPRVTRIYPGIDLEKYQYREKNFSLLSQLHIEQDDFIINFPGEYTRLGAIDLVTEAFSELAEENKEVKLLLACRVKNEKDEKKKKEIMEWAKKKKLEERVIFLDTVFEMEKVYNISDVVIFPVSDMRGKFDVPLVIPEAFASEVPVIISDLPIFSEFAKEDNSVKIKKNNKKELVSALQKLSADPEKRKSLGKTGRRFAEEHFDIRKVAGEYEKVYEKLL